ncbi:universal stress protein [Desulfallas thermosapovorans]|uniref:Nucleotide-binding universal stress UspA family protein n=1 Tax=Desulfallas thermosapovorans DSM 6562 TaxID=1121431 RepID=A0A5S4ZN49_9FIRM|nr:universal stress protein [Desulfallas thermosapovorans]TYO93370.1 nucleotide-binding universal stress UspA family protein [Desulfallas thermosapovorans DSM 6562]
MGKQIIFVTDGSPSADRAGAMALDMAALMKINIKALYILDRGWGSLLGDEWINTSETRMKFFHWFEGELKDRAGQVLEEFRNRAQARGIPVETEIVTGNTLKVISRLASEPDTSLLVLPNPNSTKPAAAAGLKFNIRHLAQKIQCPLLLGPREPF